MFITRIDYYYRDVYKRIGILFTVFSYFETEVERSLFFWIVFKL